jgi:hypothetical protein
MSRMAGDDLKIDFLLDKNSGSWDGIYKFREMLE